MGTIASRLAKLEQLAGGDGGQAVCGIMRRNDATGLAPDVVRVQPSGETMTEAEFRRRYPRGLIVVRMEYSEPTADDLKPA